MLRLNLKKPTAVLNFENSKIIVCVSLHLDQVKHVIHDEIHWGTVVQHLMVNCMVLIKMIQNVNSSYKV